MDIKTLGTNMTIRVPQKGRKKEIMHGLLHVLDRGLIVCNVNV